jgi:subtilase family serine protease
MNRKLGLIATVVAIAGLALTWEGISRTSAAQEAPHARVLISEPIDEGRLIPLARNTRREANAKTDRGRVPDDFAMEHMLLLLNRPPELEQEFEQYIESLTDKSSPNYHHWLTPEEQGQQYGLAQDDVDAVTGWLQSHGFTVGYVYPTRRVIDFSGTAGQIREAFHTEIHHLDVGGERHFANMSDPQIPEALAPVVLGVVSMHDFKPHSYLKPRTQYQVTSGSGGTYNLVVPADAQTIYNLAPVYRQGIYGQGQTIVVIEDAMPWGTDPTTYQNTFNLGVYGGSWSNTHPNAGGNCTAPTSPNGDEGEANIDVEIALAVAPGATIEAASCNDGTPVSTFGGLLALENLVSAGSPPALISMSYGECEAGSTQGGNAAFYTAFQSAAAAGVSVFVSSGDELSSSCSSGYDYGYFGIGVTGWGSTPYNVAVGGTDFEDNYNAKKAEPTIPVSTYWNSSNSTYYGNAKSYVPEIPWNDSCASWLISNYEGYSTTYGSSGFCNSSTAENNDAYLTVSGGSGGPSGCANGASTTGYVTTGCAGYSKPSWQSGILGNPSDGVRDLPDVSLLASNGVWGHFYVICWSDTANYASQGAAACTNPPNPLASTPTWSGFGGTSVSAPMMAAIQALVNQKWNIRAGNPNPIYYQIAKTEFGSTGNSSCYSINQPPRRGLASACAFYDITQGDINANCVQNGTDHPCYIPSGTNGVLSAETVSAVSVVQGGSGYTSAPTCTLGGPATSTAYLSPTGAIIYGGGTQAGTCTASINAGSTTAAGTVVISGTVATDWAGATLTVGGTTYTFVTGTPTAVNQVELYTSASASTNRTDTARNLEAVLNATSSQCASTGCVYGGQTANSSVTATEATNTVTLTAKNNGAAGNFTLVADNNQYSDIVPTITTIGAGPGYVSSIAFTASGAGYAGGSGCTLAGGGGSGATCAAEVSITTAPTVYAPAFYATPGWDFATGIGSPNAYNLIFNTAW